MRNVFKRISSVVVVLSLVLVNIASMPTASAASLNAPQIILTNMNTGGNSAVIIKFTTVAGTGTNVSVAFPTYIGTTNGIVTGAQSPSQNYNGISCTTITGASSYLPGTPTASGAASTITFAGVTALSATTSYCAVLTGTAVTNPTAANSYSATITAGADSPTPGAIDVIANDQVVVNASVPASFTLALGANIDNFTAAGNALSTGSVSTTTGITATINTNATNGWSLYGSDATTGLKSTVLNYTIPSKTPGSNATITTAAEGYLTALPAGGITQGSGLGVTSATAAYASSGSGNGSGLNTAPAKIASSTGTASGAIVTIKEYATIVGTTPAANDYQDTITLVGAGSF
jgi:hypothetical protein